MTEYSTHMSLKYPGTAKKIAERGRIGFRNEEFNYPQFLDSNSVGDLAIADTDNHRIQLLNRPTLLTLLHPYGEYGSGQNQLSYPRSVKFSPVSQAHIVIADTGNRRIVYAKVNPQDGFLDQYHTIGRTYLREPSDMAINPHNEMLYITDTSLSKVFIMDKFGKEMIGEFRPRFGSLNQPRGIALDKRGRAFVVDSGNNCVQVFDHGGEFITKFGGPGEVLAELNRPRGIAIDRRGYIFVADGGNNRVVMYSPDLRMMSEVVRDIPAPTGIAADENIVITCGDPYNSIKIYSA